MRVIYQTRYGNIVVFGFFAVLWTIVCLMAFTDLATAKEERKSTLEYFFKSTDFQNASAITWAHGVNSKRALRAELNGE